MRNPFSNAGRVEDDEEEEDVSSQSVISLPPSSSLSVSLFLFMAVGWLPFIVDDDDEEEGGDDGDGDEGDWPEVEESGRGNNATRASLF